jgi:hypothetical protein
MSCITAGGALDEISELFDLRVGQRDIFFVEIYLDSSSSIFVSSFV